MAVKQEIKYKVRKIDGTDGVEGTISLNVKKEGALIRYSNFFKPNGVNVNFLEKSKHVTNEEVKK